MRFCVREGLPGRSILSSSTALTQELALLPLRQAPFSQAVPGVPSASLESSCSSSSAALRAWGTGL